jgi:sulfur carrier protein
MQITVNGDARTIAEETSVADLLRELQLVPARVAVEINEQLVRRATFAERRLSAGDRVEIVTLVGGG